MKVAAWAREEISSARGTMPKASFHKATAVQRHRRKKLNKKNKEAVWGSRSSQVCERASICLLPMTLKKLRCIKSYAIDFCLNMPCAPRFVWNNESPRVSLHLSNMILVSSVAQTWTAEIATHIKRMDCQTFRTLPFTLQLYAETNTLFLYYSSFN